MKERPVIFNSEMVRAILSGRKTQTRRTVSDRHLHLIDVASQVGECYPLESGIDHANSQGYYREHCPFGQVGDRLWVRETFQGPLIPEDELSEYLGANPDKFESPTYCEYAADGGAKPEYVDSDENTRYGWRPSIHMPRWASRITLEITAVRVERLNNISEADARAEGVKAGVCPGHEHMMHQVAFSELWQSIYGVENWLTNPWVWVIEFRRVGGA